MPFVLDNSVAMRWLFEDGSPSDLDYALKVLAAIKVGEVVVPGIWCMEVANVIARAEQRFGLTEILSAEFIRRLQSLGLRFDSETGWQILSATLPVARRYKLTAYDATYLELALRTGYPLATLDVGLRKAAKRAGVKHFIP